MDIRKPAVYVPDLYKNALSQTFFSPPPAKEQVKQLSLNCASLLRNNFFQSLVNSKQIRLLSMYFFNQAAMNSKKSKSKQFKKFKVKIAKLKKEKVQQSSLSPKN